ncbi:MAG: glycoside hydrolase family 16 protein [Chloroflexota bacterium]
MFLNRMNKRPLTILLLLGVITVGLTAVFALAPPTRRTPIAQNNTQMKTMTSGKTVTLVWSDEFDGDEINLENWTYDLGGHGWGNNEWQVYTKRPDNARIEDGMLVIEARNEQYQGRKYTSARLKTEDLQAFQNGRFEARIKVPEGQGIWPAFWMLGDNFKARGWPFAGEIDIMENIGREPRTVHGTLHGPGYSGGNNVGKAHHIAGKFTDNFHVFAIEWEGEEIRWYVDDDHYFTLTPDDVPGDWVYDHPFFFILNVAVGGNWPGYPNDSTEFPQQMLVDYVRVYQ